MTNRQYFSHSTSQFLLDLKDNNNRGWFQANKPRYEQEIKQPFLHFISDFGSRVETISKNIFVDPRPNGGSMFRIYRDTRFSKDKTPYKTHAAAQFRHKAGKDVHAPGYYFHFNPNEFMFGCGTWKPDGKTVRKIREAIVAKPEIWKSIVNDPEFTSSIELGGDSLKRNPQGIDKDQPLIEDLKRKDFVGFSLVKQETVYSDRLMDEFVTFCKITAPLMKFLSEAIGLDW